MSICTISSGWVVWGPSWSSKGSFFTFPRVQASQKVGVPLSMSIPGSCPDLTICWIQLGETWPMHECRRFMSTVTCAASFWSFGVTLAWYSLFSGWWQEWCSNLLQYEVPTSFFLSSIFPCCLLIHLWLLPFQLCSSQIVISMLYGELFLIHCHLYSYFLDEHFPPKAMT